MVDHINAVYTAFASATGGRTGTAASDDDRLTVTLSTPKELGGDGGAGTNPEQLFAAGYAACFIGAIKFVGMRDKIKVPDNARIDSSVGIGPIPNGFGIAVELRISLPGVTGEDADKLIAAAHVVCPYSNATRGNIDVTLVRL